MRQADRAGRPSRPIRGTDGLVLLVACVLGHAAGARAAGSVPEPAVASPAVVRAPQYFPPLERPPLDPPLRLSATFGEYRPGHFHAGLDLSTGGAVGRPVYAALPGGVVRVRASGVGYGRSVYLQADDGRLLVYGHLDAFDEPLASQVAAVQDSTGAYEQDLWLDPARFRVAAGQRLGWSGRSGTDAPHLHFEIRRGDVAYNPLLAGVSVVDTVAPVFRRVALDPVRSRGDGTWAVHPLVLEPTGRDTALLAGLERLVVEAVDARADGRRTMAPWRIAMAGGGAEVECRFDSVSWAEGMGEVDFVYDRGRVLAGGRYAVTLWAPPGFRPGVLHTHAGLAAGAGGLALPSGGRSLTVRLLAQDVAGQAVAETLALGPAPAGPAVDPPPGQWVSADSAAAGGLPGFVFRAAPGTLYETARLAVAALGRPDAPDELRPRSRVYALEPALTPLRAPLRVAIAEAGRRGDLAARAPDGVALYRDAGGGWEYLGAEAEPRAGWVGAPSRALGRFALFRDATAPRIRPRTPPRAAPAGDYPRWALEAVLTEQGSGVDARASYLAVDGRRVPSEWDAVANTLRWRPLRPPGTCAAGTRSLC